MAEERIPELTELKRKESENWLVDMNSLKSHEIGEISDNLGSER